MPRPISLEGLRDLYAQETGSSFHWGITISHPAMPEPIRIISDSVAHTIGGHEYLAAPCTVVMAADSEEQMPQPRIRGDAVQRDIIAFARSVDSPADVTLELFRIDAADQVTREWGPMDFSLLSFRVPDAASMEAILGYQTNWLDEPAMSYRFTPTLAPGLY